MTKELEKKCNHHLKCIYCKKEFSPLDSTKHISGDCMHTQGVFITNNITTVVIIEADKKPSFLHKLFHHFLKNF